MKINTLKNTIAWFQIPVLNFERAIKFYSTILSIEFIQSEAMGTQVAIFPHDRASGAVGGALYYGKGFVPASAGTTVFLNAGDDLSGVLTKVEGAGGKILLAKTPINNGSGFIAHFSDTEGNRVGLHSKN